MTSANTAPYVIVSYDKKVHQSSLLSAIADSARMPESKYPGPRGGTSHAEHLQWLESIPLNERWVGVDPAGNVQGHVALSPAGHSGVIAGVGPDAVEVTRLLVRPTARRQGLGAALLSHAATAAAGQSPEGVILLVSDYLDEAIALYERAGWARVGEKTSRISGDHMLVYALLPDR